MCPKLSECEIVSSVSEMFVAVSVKLGEFTLMTRALPSVEREQLQPVRHAA